MTFASVVLGIIGLVHLVPATAVFGERLARLYGVAPEGDTALLLRHRAVLFGVLGAVCFAAVLRPAWQVPVLGCALVSTASFVALSLRSPGLSRIRRVDVVLSILILVALWTERGALPRG